LNSYELIVLIDPNLGEEKIEALVAKVEGKIKSLGGEIEKIDKWGTKRLASMIKKAKKLTQAHYVAIYFRSEPAIPEGLKKFLKVTENIVRYSLIRAAEKKLAEIEGTPVEEKGEADAVNVGEIKGDAGGES